MQTSEFEKELGAKLVEDQQGATALTEIGRDVARRAADILERRALPRADSASTRPG
jgi:DNA-binding transcriptional LysR family regulator